MIEPIGILRLSCLVRWCHGRPTKPCDAYRAQATIAQIRVIVAFALPNMRTLYVSALSLIGIKEEAFRR